MTASEEIVQSLGAGWIAVSYSKATHEKTGVEIWKDGEKYSGHYLGIYAFSREAPIDVLDKLAQELLHASSDAELRAIKLLTIVCSSHGSPREHEAFARAIESAENKAPHLHKALMNRAFNGDAMLKNKYDELTRFHNDLRHKALNIATAADEAARKEAELELHARKLADHERLLEREQERLMLIAGERKIDLTLPALPKLHDDEEASDG